MVDAENRDDLRLRAKRISSTKRYDIVLRTYSLLGMFVAIIGLGYFAITLLPFELSSEQRLALMTGGVGIALATMSKLLITLRKERESVEDFKLRDYEASASFLDAWNEFELVSRRLVSGDSKSLSHMPPRALFGLLLKEGKLKDADIGAVEFALKIRNALMHGSIRVPPDVLRDVADGLRKINARVLVGADTTDSPAK
jgi:hypothetical protein